MSQKYNFRKELPDRFLLQPQSGVDKSALIVTPTRGPSPWTRL